ncbi:MAG: PulJ/GspJ family protein [Planctomycetota bacterium]|jgi:hypothetical protein
MRNRAARHLRRAVTLLEIALAMGLLVLVSSMTYWFYADALETRDAESEVIRKWRLARVTLEAMANEIRQASLIPHGGVAGIVGDAEAIRVSTVRMPVKNVIPGGLDINGKPNPQTDLIRVEYRIARHPDIVHEEEGYELPLGLIRNEVLTEPDDTDPDAVDADGFPIGSDGQALDSDSFKENSEDGADVGFDINWQELYAPEIKFLRFCYFDGSTWWDKWHVSGENPLPQLVHIAIGFEGGAPFGEEFGTPEELEYCECMNEDPQDCVPTRPDRMSTVVKVQLADPLFRSRIGAELSNLGESLGAEDEEGGR